MQLNGTYIPLDTNVKNPYNKSGIVKVYSLQAKDTIEFVELDQVLFPSARPYQDTIVFLPRKLVRAWSRSTRVTCSMRVSQLEELEYSLRKDTLISKHVRYLVRGDTCIRCITARFMLKIDKQLRENH